MTLNLSYKTKREIYGVVLSSGAKMVTEDKTFSERFRNAIKMMKEVRPDLCGDKMLMRLAAYIQRHGKGVEVKPLVVSFCDMIDSSFAC